MKTSLSRLMLGTVQFGQSYGVANQSGVPAFSEICAMLEEAAAAGVNGLDTALAYGDSEMVLGRALKETGLRDHFLVVTKTDNRLSPDLPLPEAIRAIRAGVEQSLERLQIDHLPLVLLHRDTAPLHLDALAKCREAGLIDGCGVSVADVENALRLLPHPGLAAVQLPMNVLDHRFCAFARSVRLRQGRVFARSCYLQGLLLMDDASTPAHLRVVEAARAFYRHQADTLGLPLAELLLRAMLERDEVDSVVVGVENLAQLRENLRIFRAGPLPAGVTAEISSFDPKVPDWVVDPAQWPAHAETRTA